MGTQVGNGQGLGTTFTGGVQLDGNSDSGIGGFVAGGVNNGDANGITPGLQTGFGISQQNGQNVATAQLGGNIQAPQLGGVQFNRPNNAFGVQPTVLGQPAPGLNLFNLFGGQRPRTSSPRGPRVLPCSNPLANSLDHYIITMMGIRKLLFLQSDLTSIFMLLI